LPDHGQALKVTAIAASAQLGGTERVLLDFALHAFEHGIALRVLTPRDGPLVALLNEQGVPAQAAPAASWLLRASQQPGHLRSLAPAALGLLHWARRLGRHEFVRDAAVVYTIAFKAHAAAALARARPVVWHLHEFPPQRTGRLWRWLARRLPAAMIANSEAVADAWRGQKAEGRGQKAQGRGHRAEGRRQNAERRTAGAGDPPNRRSADPPILVVPNGVDLDRFRPRERRGWLHEALGLPPGARLVGMPAAFARWKGQLEVIEAFRLVQDDLPGAHLVIVGGSIYDTVAERTYGEELHLAVQGKTAEADRRMPNAEGGGKDAERRTGDTERGDDATHRSADPPIRRIHLLPFQDDIERLYPELDLVVHYSTRPEPFGRVVIEAMACGIPVIAAAEGGPLEILGEHPGSRQPAGWLVEPRDPVALAGTLREALGAPLDALRATGQAGRHRAEDRYSARRFAREVAGVLTSVSREA
jgi:glycosyltransferase involved in cell wall biosynthesis